MPSLKMRAGDDGYVRMRVIEAASDAFQILIDDGVSMAVTIWVPVGECARLQDIGELKPPRRANLRHMDR